MMTDEEQARILRFAREQFMGASSAAGDRSVRKVMTPLGKTIYCRTADEFYRVTRWVAELNQREVERRAKQHREVVSRAADSPWRTDGRAEEQRTR